MLVARVFDAMESKLRFDNRTIPDTCPGFEVATPDKFKIPHGWCYEADSMSFWPLLSCPNIFNYLMFYPTELGSKDLSD